MTLKYRTLYFDKDFDEVVNLCAEWWEEAGFYKNTGIKYKVSHAQFKAIDDAGALLAVGGFDEEGKLATCFIGAAGPFVFNSDYIQATEMVWHVRPDVRSFETLSEFLTHIDIMMEAKGIDLWNLSLPPEHLKTEKALKHFGYFKQDTHFMKIIRRPNHG